MKVYLSYPWKYPDSSYYKSIVNHSPKGVEFVNKLNSYNISSTKSFKFNNDLKNVVRNVMKLTCIPNLVFQKKGDYDILHCAHCLNVGDKSWVVDVEHYWNFASSSYVAYSWLGKKLISKYLLKENCKKIIAWTDSAKDTITDAIKNKKITDKIDVLPYAIPLPKSTKKKHDGINLLFIGRYFYAKGGPDALSVMDYLTKKYDNVNGIIVSDLSYELSRLNKNKKIKFYDLMPQEKLFEEIYPISDIFIYPGYSDTFGFAMVESMSFGIPVVTAKGFARDEIISNEKTGFIVKKENVVKSMIDKVEELINSKQKLDNMSKRCIEEVGQGKFSIESRNKKLKKIYEDCL